MPKNPFIRGSALGRARDDTQRSGSFRPGHEKLGGRKRGTPNAISPDIKHLILRAATRVGFDGAGKDGLVGYLTWVAQYRPPIYAKMLSIVLVLDDVTNERVEKRGIRELNEDIAEFLGSDQPGRYVYWPQFEYEIHEDDLLDILTNLAIMEPSTFCKLLGALLPRQRKQPASRFP